jgi:glycosyltransferase involved in cell wall biosynthesis
MLIGIDVSQTGALRAGCGNVSYELVQALAELDRKNEYLLYPTFGDQFWDDGWRTDTVLPMRYNFRRGLHHDSYTDARQFWYAPPTDFEFRMGNPDIIHSHNFFCPPALSRAKLVYTLHDIGFVEHPEWTTEINRVSCFRGVFQASIRADLIVAVSHFSRNHFLSTFPHVAPERVEVVHLASRFRDNGAIACPERLRSYQGRDFLFTLGTLEPRKNYPMLARAYAQLVRQRRYCPPLLIAGGKGWMFDGFMQHLAELGIADRVHMLGFSSDNEIRWLMQNCTAFVFTSYWEGYGLPVIEAMSQGAFVVASRAASLPEVTGDAALLVDPFDAGSIAAALERALDDDALRQAGRERSLLRAREFSWEKSARRLLGHYEDLLRRPPFTDGVVPPMARPTRWPEARSRLTSLARRLLPARRT